MALLLLLQKIDDLKEFVDAYRESDMFWHNVCP